MEPLSSAGVISRNETTGRRSLTGTIITVMKRRLSRLFALLMLLNLAVQPLLVQARAVQNTAPPCPMQMQQQMGHHDMAAHSDCAGHSIDLCASCDLCGHSGGNAFLPTSLFDGPVSSSAVMDDAYHRVFVSITLPVDSPPPRSL